MFNLIKRGVKEMAKTVNNMISNNNEVELAKIKLAEGCIKGVVNAVANTIKDPHVRRVVGVIIVSVGVGLGGGLIASSYV